jgi:membrane-associated phospholipid phosphatase
VLWFAFAAVFLILWAVLYAVLPALRFVGRRLTRLVARSARIQEMVTRHKSWLPVAVIVIAGAALTAWAGDGFLDLAERVRANAPAMRKFDTGVHDWAVSHRSGADTLFFDMMSSAGAPYGVAAIGGIVGLVLAIRRRWRWVLYLAVTMIGGDLFDWELKRYFARARPAMAEALRQAHGYSFPSGHAMGSTVAAGALAYLAYRASKSWPTAAASLAFGVTFVLAVAVSRVYLGVHWISDVAAGISAGFVWVITTTVAYETLRRIRHLRGLREAARHPSARSAASTDRAPSVRS